MTDALVVRNLSVLVSTCRCVSISSLYSNVTPLALFLVLFLVLFLFCFSWVLLCLYIGNQLQHSTSGSTAVGIGVGISIGIEDLGDSTVPAEAAKVDFTLDSVTR